MNTSSSGLRRAGNLAAVAACLALAWAASGPALGLVRLLSAGVKHAHAWISPFGADIVFYSDTAMRAPVCRRAALAMTRDFGAGSPALGVPRDRFSDRWTAWLVVPRDGDYKFYTKSDDGIRVLIDNQPVIDNWRENDWATSGTHGAMTLSAGRHVIVLEHFDLRDRAALRLLWFGPGIPPNTVVGKPYLRKVRPRGETPPQPPPAAGGKP